jgi:outer membrane lipoprotein SlyB
MQSTILRGLLVAAFAFGSAAHADDTAHDTAAMEVHGIRLGSLCAGCGVVAERRVETRDGNANGVGAVTGALVGGVLGHQIGSGGGRGAATVLGAVGGGFAGNAIEKKAKKVEVWHTSVTFRDGSTRTFEDESDPGVFEGQVVRIDAGRPVRVD